jgi:predicted RNase H-related nuclease YkuK (DUF458 family)
MKKDIEKHIEQEIEIQKSFNSPSLGILTFKEVTFWIGKFMHNQPDANYELIIGSDSQCYNNYVDFVSAIVVHRVGGGAMYFWHRVREHNKKYVLRDRMYTEAILSIDIAQEFMEQFKVEGILKFSLEIHVDIGENGKTKDLIKEVVGMIRGNGFVVKTKPQAYAAANIADRHT